MSAAGKSAVGVVHTLEPMDALETDRPEVVTAACRLLEGSDAPVEEVARELGWSQRHLQRLFRDTAGVTMSAYRRQARADRVRTHLRTGATVTEAVFAAGYGSSRAFYDHGARRLGMSPAQYSDGGRGATIRFTTFETAIGIVLAAVTDRGLCAVRIGDDAQELIDGLREELPEAASADVADDPQLASVSEVLWLLAHGRPGDRLPLDVQGTALQAEVWEAISSIPAGTTMTYAELAAAVGRPTAVRAVANAVGANPVALAIPCHRVVRSDGSNGGYRWGGERKAALLTTEQGDEAEPS